MAFHREFEELIRTEIKQTIPAIGTETDAKPNCSPKYKSVLKLTNKL